MIPKRFLCFVVVMMLANQSAAFAAKRPSPKGTLARYQKWVNENKGILATTMLALGAVLYLATSRPQRLDGFGGGGGLRLGGGGLPPPDGSHTSLAAAMAAAAAINRYDDPVATQARAELIRREEERRAERDARRAQMAAAEVERREKQRRAIAEEVQGRVEAIQALGQLLRTKKLELEALIAARNWTSLNGILESLIVELERCAQKRILLDDLRLVLVLMQRTSSEAPGPIAEALRIRLDREITRLNDLI